MKTHLLLGYLTFIFIFFSEVTQGAPSIFGRYVGVLKHDALKRDQLAKLDFILSQEEAGKLNLSAVLTVHFGDFNSTEYVAYHFDNVEYNVTKQTLIFDQPNKEVTVLVKKFAGGVFEGELRSNFSGNVGKLVLEKDGTAKPTLPLIEPIWGEYEGKCNGVETRLQLETFQSSDDALNVGNPFATYRIHGQLGENRGSPCGLFETGTKYCLWANFDSGSYNFYKNRLVLMGPNRNLSCQTTEDGLKCDKDCDLKRISFETKTPRLFKPRTSSPGFETITSGPALKVPVDAIQGEYTGYLHHEYLDRYQPASLNILTYESPGSTPEDPKLQLSAVANLNFGDAENGETIPYRFVSRQYPSPLLAPQFVFRRPEADVDANLQITEFGDGVVKGVWYSNLFGRVGTFELRKDGAVKIPINAKLVESISGFYESDAWDVNVVVGLGKTPPNTHNAIAPLTFGGWTILKSITPRITITGGSYDFYTGKIAFQIGEKSAFIGERIARNRLALKKTYFAIITPLQENDLTLFRLIP